MPTPINIAFKPLYTSSKRYFFVTGSRGSLKTTSVSDYIARLTYQREHGVLYTRYTLTSAEHSIIPEFERTLHRLGVHSDFYITRTRVINKRTGSFIHFAGIKTSSGNQTAKLKSITGITTWVIEEGEDFDDEQTFDDIDNSIRTTTHQNRVIWIMNPPTREHFTYKRWIENNSQQVDFNGFNVTISADPEVEHIHTTYHIAEKLGFLSESWLAKADKLKNQMEVQIENVRKNWTKTTTELDLEIYKIKHTSNYYYTYIGGWLERAEGVIFDNWIEGEFDNTLPMCHALDYGYSPDPLAMLDIAVDHKKRRIYIKERIYETEIDEIVSRFSALGINKRTLIVCDTNEPRTTQAIRKAGYNIQEVFKTVATKNESGIAQDIREIRGYLIVVDPKSKNIKIELNNYVWNDKKSSIPIDAYNHLMDCLRYGFNRLRGKKRKGVRLRN